MGDYINCPNCLTEMNSLDVDYYVCPYCGKMIDMYEDVCDKDEVF